MNVDVETNVETDLELVSGLVSVSMSQKKCNQKPSNVTICLYWGYVFTLLVSVLIGLSKS